VFFYRRSIALRADVADYVVYAVVASEDGSKPDSLPAIAGFPAGWRPTENPGQCLADFSTEPSVYCTFVPRNQFRHYTRIERGEALGLYPDLSD
jgi:hypothetical protein